MIEGIAATDIGLSGLVVLTVLLILTGRLVPRRVVDDVRADRDAYRTVVENIAPQIEKLAANDETTLAILRSLPHPSDPSRAHEPEMP